MTSSLPYFPKLPSASDVSAVVQNRLQANENKTATTSQGEAVPASGATRSASLFRFNNSMSAVTTSKTLERLMIATDNPADAAANDATTRRPRFRFELIRDLETVRESCKRIAVPGCHDAIAARRRTGSKRLRSACQGNQVLGRIQLAQNGLHATQGVFP